MCANFKSVTHEIEHNGLQALIHNPGGFAKVMCADFILKKRNPTPLEVFVGAETVTTNSSHADWLKCYYSNFETLKHFETL